MFIVSIFAFFVFIFLLATITVAIAWMAFLKRQAEDADAGGRIPAQHPSYDSSVSISTLFRERTPQLAQLLGQPADALRLRGDSEERV